MKNSKWIKSLSLAIVSGVVFLAVILLIYFLRYSELMDFQLLTQFYLIFTIIGMLALFFSYKRFVIIFFGGAIMGLIVNCITTYREAGHTTMAGGIYNFLITALFFIVAIIVQVVYQMKKRRK